MYRCLVHLSLIIIQFNTYKLILQHKTFWCLKWVSITIDKYVGNASVPHVGRGKEVRQSVVTIEQMDQMASTQHSRGETSSHQCKVQIMSGSMACGEETLGFIMFLGLASSLPTSHQVLIHRTTQFLVLGPWSLPNTIPPRKTTSC